MVVFYLTSMMSSVSPLASLQARLALDERIDVEAGPGATYCDENGTWLRHNNGHWQFIAPALTSLAVG